MPVPFPTDDVVNLSPPTHEESVRNAAGILAATRPDTGNTDFQRLLIEATFASLTGHEIDAGSLPDVDAITNAENLATRAEGFRMRMVHMMILSALVLRPIPPEVATRVGEFSRELGMAAKWDALGRLPEDTIGRQLHRFYQARGFEFPGRPGSAPPLLAQHDWVHVLAGYGTRVEAELEVFAFIARANDDPRGFSLLAMVISLFETGYLSAGAGLFEAFPGQLSQDGMTVRVGDAMRRGALSHGLEGAPDVDFMAVDWFDLADRPVEELRELFNVVPKDEAAIAAGSVTAWEPGGISEAQLAMGQAYAEREGIDYESFGAEL